MAVRARGMHTGGLVAAVAGRMCVYLLGRSRRGSWCTRVEAAELVRVISGLRWRVRLTDCRTEGQAGGW